MNVENEILDLKYNLNKTMYFINDFADVYDKNVLLTVETFNQLFYMLNVVFLLFFILFCFSLCNSKDIEILKKKIQGTSQQTKVLDV